MERPDAARPGRLAALEDPYMLAALSGCCVLLLAATLPVWGPLWAVVCPLRALTGIPCPTCFGTRATLALVAGDWRRALALNPLVTGGGIVLVALVPWAFATALGALPRPRLSATTLERLAWAGVGLTLANWVYLVAVNAGN